MSRLLLHRVRKYDTNCRYRCMICDKKLNTHVMPGINNELLYISAEHPKCIFRCIHTLNYESLSTILDESFNHDYIDSMYFALDNKMEEYLTTDNILNWQFYILFYINKSIMPSILCYMVRYTRNRRIWFLDKIIALLHTLIYSKNISTADLSHLLSRIKINTYVYNALLRYRQTAHWLSLGYQGITRELADEKMKLFNYVTDKRAKN